jgi:hypothetical protein
MKANWDFPCKGQKKEKQPEYLFMVTLKKEKQPEYLFIVTLKKEKQPEYLFMVTLKKGKTARIFIHDDILFPFQFLFII